MKLSEIDESDLDKVKVIQGEILERIQLVAPLFKRAFTAFECKIGLFYYKMTEIYKKSKRSTDKKIK